MGFFRKQSDSISDNEPRFNALKYEQSTYGATKPVLYGTNRLCGNVIDSVDFKSVKHENTTRMGKGAGQSSTTVTYTYTARVVIALCEGMIQGIRKVLIDKGTYSLSDLNLNLLKGSSNQPAWGEMTTKHPAHALNYRNLAYVAGNIDLTSNAGIPQFNFEVNGKFTSNTDDITPVIEEGFHFSTDSGTLSNCKGTLDYSSYFRGVLKVRIVYYDSSSREYENNNFTNYTQTTSSGKVEFTFNLSGLGAVSAHVYVTYNSSVRLDANPKDIIFDILTNKNYGAGFDNSLIDETSLDKFSNFCIASNIFLSPLYDSQQEAQQCLSDIAEISNSTFIWAQGKLKIIPLGDETISDNGKTFIPDLTPIYDLTEDDFLCDDGEEPITCSRKSQADVKNSIKIEYLNRANNYNTEIAEAQDLANISQYGFNPADVITARQICTSEIAQKAAETALARSIAVRNTYSFKLPYRYVLLDCMDLITLTSPRLGLDRQLVKITSIKEDDGVLEFEAEEMIVGTATPARYTTQNASFESVDTATSVGNINAPIIFEPSFEMSQNNLEVWLGISSSQNLFGGGEVWISEDNETYKQIGELRQSVRQGVLTNALPSVNSEIDNTNTLAIDVSMSNSEILSGTEADMENLNTLCYVDGEFISYQNATLVDDYKYYLTNLKRGVYYSAPSAHSANTQFCRIDKDCFMKIPFNSDDIGKTIYIKICSFNTFNGGLQDLANAEVYQYTILGNAKKIFPDDVTNFNVIQKGSEYVFSWTFTSSTDTYEIREGDSWETGVLIGKNIPLNSYASDIIMTGEKHFWIKSHNGMNYSDNATEDVIYVSDIPDSNVVVAYDLLSDLQNGTYQGTKAYKNTVKMTSSLKWQTKAAKWGQGTESDKYYQKNGVWGRIITERSQIAAELGEEYGTIDAGTLSQRAENIIDCGLLSAIEPTKTEGYYISAVQDLGGALESGVRGTIGLVSNNDTVSAMLQWRYCADNDGVTENGGIITPVESAWSEWETLTQDGVLALFRYYQCRIHFISSGGQIVCTDANIIIDVPDKIINRTVTVTTASDGAEVEFEFYAPPSIVATVNQNINAYAVVTEKDENHAVIKIYDNDGTAVTGTADLIIKGY